MRAVVVDASAVAKYLLRTTRAERFAGTIEAGDILLHVPALCDVELIAVLRRALLGKQMTEGRAWEAMSDYMEDHRLQVQAAEGIFQEAGTPTGLYGSSHQRDLARLRQSNGT